MTIAPQSSAQIALKLLGAASAPARGSAISSIEQTTGTQTTGTQTTTSQTASLRSTKIQLSAKAAIDYFGAGSEISKAISGLGESVTVQTSGLDIPADKGAFRQQVLDYFAEYYANNAALDPDQVAFSKAVQEGKVIVKTVDETPELNWQPDIGWAVYRDGYPQGGGITSKPIGNEDLFNSQTEARGQAVGSIGGHYYYAYFEKEPQ